MAEHKRHQGHRQRMRERVQNYGLDSLAEHEALEYVLYLTALAILPLCWKPARKSCALWRA